MYIRNRIMKSRYLIILLAALLFTTCGKTDVPDVGDGIEAKPTGTLNVVFKISHPWIPVNRIVRAELHIATTGTEIYKGNYIQSANVSNNQELYVFYLEPGTYYYEAVISCLCEGDSCSGGGFPGNKWGTKHVMDKFTITENKVTQVVPTFQ
jgi:hypothetical protein